MRLKIDLKGRTNPLDFTHVTSVERKVFDNELYFRVDYSIVNGNNEKEPLHDIVPVSEIERVSVCADCFNEDDLRNMLVLSIETGVVYTFGINLEKNLEKGDK